MPCVAADSFKKGQADVAEALSRTEPTDAVAATAEPLILEASFHPGFSSYPFSWHTTLTAGGVLRQRRPTTFPVATTFAFHQALKSQHPTAGSTHLSLAWPITTSAASRGFFDESATRL